MVVMVTNSIRMIFLYRIFLELLPDLVPDLVPVLVPVLVLVPVPVPVLPVLLLVPLLEIVAVMVAHREVELRQKAVDVAIEPDAIRKIDTNFLYHKN